MFKGRIGCSARRAFDSSMHAFLQMTQDLTRELIKEVKRSEQINKDMQSKTKQKIPLQNPQEVLVPHLPQMDARFEKGNEKELTNEMPRNLTIESQRDVTRRCGKKPKKSAKKNT